MSKQNRKWLSLLSGITLSLLVYFINPFQVPETAARVLAIATLMISWWVTEALPMAVTALLPLILFPVLQISSIDDTARPYGNPIIFLFMGGFMLGLAIEKWSLHKRIALQIVRLTGTSGDRIILGFILATGLLSMWLSNTATTMMMFPIALSVIQVMKDNPSEGGNLKNFSLALMLVIAFASNLSIGTIIGTPPNVAYVGHIYDKYGFSVDAMKWMLLCTPLSALLLFALYIVLTKWLYPNRIQTNRAAQHHITGELHALGPLTTPEKRVLAVFVTTAILWMGRDLINKNQSLFRLDDTIIAVMCMLALFVIPSGEKKDISKPHSASALLEWGDTKRMAWGILLLFGGGITLATALEKANLIQQMGDWLAQFGNNEFMLILMITLISLFLSEVMSNVAQVTVMAPVVSSLADSLNMNPLLLGIPMTLAASCAGMLPMGTPPNAIAFSSGQIRLRDMLKAGFVMNIISVILITVVCWYLLPLIFNIQR